MSNDAPSDYRLFLRTFMKGPEDNQSVQVLDGTSNDHDINEFDGSTPAGIHKVLAYIRDNGLQRTKPWNTVWNLHQMLIASLEDAHEFEEDAIPTSILFNKDKP